MIDDYGIISEHKTFTGNSDVTRNLERKEYFEFIEDEKLVTKQALSSKKKQFDIGVTIPSKKVVTIVQIV